MNLTLQRTVLKVLIQEASWTTSRSGIDKNYNILTAFSIDLHPYLVFTVSPYILTLEKGHGSIKPV